METETVMMPRELTAENGAKTLLIGEFEEYYSMDCPECDSDNPNDECEICHGHIYYDQPVSVSWTTIKEIYTMAVKHLAAIVEWKHCNNCTNRDSCEAHGCLEESLSVSIAPDRLNTIKQELKTACPGEAYHADSKTEAELMANRFMDRCAELLEILESSRNG